MKSQNTETPKSPKVETSDTQLMRAWLIDLGQAVAAAIAATHRPGEPVLRAGFRYREFVESRLSRMEALGFHMEWQPHRTAGPGLQNLRVTYAGNRQEEGNKATRQQGKRREG